VKSLRTSPRLPGLGLYHAAALLSVVLVLSCGCTARRPKAYSVIPDKVHDRDLVARAQTILATLYPSEYRATQRAIITVGKQQFVCDGVLTASPQTGYHLAVVSTLGLVTELRVNTNRTSEVLRSTPLFREDWSREYVARDVKRLFAPRQDANTPGRLNDGRYVLETTPTAEGLLIRYIFSPDAAQLQEVEVEEHDARVYHATLRRYRRFAGFTKEVPSEIEAVSPSYRLNLRTAAMTVPAAGAAE
jgi:hypothetical protein